jgi:hypothetical protein
VVTAEEADRTSAVTVATEGSGVRPRYPAAEHAAMADLMQRFVEPCVPCDPRAVPSQHECHMVQGVACPREGYDQGEISEDG